MYFSFRSNRVRDCRLPWHWQWTLDWTRVVVVRAPIALNTLIVVETHRMYAMYLGLISKRFIKLTMECEREWNKPWILICSKSISTMPVSLITKCNFVVSLLKSDEFKEISPVSFVKTFIILFNPYEKKKRFFFKKKTFYKRKNAY